MTTEYAEDWCALNWRFLTVGLYAPVAAIVLVVAALIAGVQAFFWAALAILMVALLAWVVCSGEWVHYAWPVGIRLDGTGMSIGGARWARSHPGQVRSRQATVPRQYSQVFACPWSGVLSIGVTTDRDLCRFMNRRAYRGRKLTPLGNLAVPFMRGALVIWVDETQARVPDIRPATGVLWLNFPEAGYRQAIWVAPTRRPVELVRALSLLPLPAGTVRDPRDLFISAFPVADWVSR